MRKRRVAWTFGAVLALGCGAPRGDTAIERSAEQRLSAEASSRGDSIEAASRAPGASPPPAGELGRPGQPIVQASP